MCQYNYKYDYFCDFYKKLFSKYKNYRYDNSYISLNNQANARI